MFLVDACLGKPADLWQRSGKTVNDADLGERGIGFWHRIKQKLHPSITKLNPSEILPKYWIIERTFSWFNQSRGLSKDYEIAKSSAEAMIKIAHFHTLLKRS